jgi:hypothetical protein
MYVIYKPPTNSNYTGLARAGVKVDDFYQAWMADDLVGLIERTFEQKYGTDKGWYYSVWFQQNKDKIGRNRACKVCGKTTKVQRCAQCLKVGYCSKECQKSDWKSHKAFCKEEKASPFVIQL